MLRLLPMLFCALIAGAGCPGGPATGAKHDDGHDEHAGGEDHHEQGDSVQLTKEAIARNAVRVDVARGGRLGAGIDVPAEIALAPDQIAHVTLLVPGRITAVKKTLGDKVKADEVIALVESAELGAAQSAQTQADAQLDVAKKAFDRQGELKNAGIGTQRTFDEAEAAVRRAEADLTAANQRTRVYGSAGSSTLSLRAPLTGEIVERHASVGEVVAPGGEPLFVVANLSTVVIEARLAERHVAAAVQGAPVRVSLQAYPGQVWEAKLDYVSPRLDEKSRTLTVRATLKNDGRLKPGLFGTVTLLTGTDDVEPRAIVPAAAVQRTADADIVFVPGGTAGVFKRVSVVVSARRGDEVEITEGLKPGDSVVVEGAFVVRSELQRSVLGEGHAH